MLKMQSTGTCPAFTMYTHQLFVCTNCLFVPSYSKRYSDTKSQTSGFSHHYHLRAYHVHRSAKPVYHHWFLDNYAAIFSTACSKNCEKGGASWSVYRNHGYLRLVIFALPLQESFIGQRWVCYYSENNHILPKTKSNSFLPFILVREQLLCSLTFLYCEIKHNPSILILLTIYS